MCRLNSDVIQDLERALGCAVVQAVNERGFISFVKKRNIQFFVTPPAAAFVEFHIQKDSRRPAVGDSVFKLAPSKVVNDRSVDVGIPVG